MIFSKFLLYPLTSLFCCYLLPLILLLTSSTNFCSNDNLTKVHSSLQHGYQSSNVKMVKKSHLRSRHLYCEKIQYGTVLWAAKKKGASKKKKVFYYRNQPIRYLWNYSSNFKNLKTVTHLCKRGQHKRITKSNMQPMCSF